MGAGQRAHRARLGAISRRRHQLGRAAALLQCLGMAPFRQQAAKRNRGSGAGELGAGGCGQGGAEAGTQAGAVQPDWLGATPMWV